MGGTAVTAHRCTRVFSDDDFIYVPRNRIKKKKKAHKAHKDPGSCLQLQRARFVLPL